MQNWRWDQGRNFGYFRFDSIKLIAKALADLEGVRFQQDSDPLRDHLQAQTGLEFPPTNEPDYPVWRNFGRIFECCSLATRSNTNPKTLLVTDVCRWLARSVSVPVDVDEYLSLWIPRYYNPIPRFSDYDPTAKQYFPFCAVLKYLLAQYEQTGGEPSISLDEVFSLIIGNDCTGIEVMEHYKELPPTGYTLLGDASRQVKESLAFVSQLSFLKWQNNRLFLDILSGDTESEQAIRSIVEPDLRTRNANRVAEILDLGRIIGTSATSAISSARRQPADVRFTEGKRVRVTHLRTERSPYLRRAFFESLTTPYICNMCECDLEQTYPWTQSSNILEVHHLLPLASALFVSPQGTSLEDVVALCPNCHRSIHVYYKTWLNNNRVEDFQSKKEAREVYLEAKEQVRM
jgi:hypothetical protein